MRLGLWNFGFQSFIIARVRSMCLWLAYLLLAQLLVNKLAENLTVTLGEGGSEPWMSLC